MWSGVEASTTQSFRVTEADPKARPGGRDRELGKGWHRLKSSPVFFPMPQFHSWKVSPRPTLLCGAEPGSSDFEKTLGGWEFKWKQGGYKVTESTHPCPSLASLD